MKKIIIAVIVTLSVLVGLSTRSATTSAAETNVIATIQFTGQNSFSYNATSLYDGSNVIDFNSIMPNVFQAGANASWQLTVQITITRMYTKSFTMLLSNLWEWNSDYDSLEIETTNSSNSLIYETESPPNIITSNNFPSTSGYITYITLSTFGYNFTDLILSFQNDGYTQGYNQGYNDGLLQGNNQGYNQGYIQGETSGYNEGYEKGFREGSESENDLYSMVLAVVDTPFTIFDYIFDFDVLGINIKNIILSFATIAIAVFVIKKFI